MTPTAAQQARSWWVFAYRGVTIVNGNDETEVAQQYTRAKLRKETLRLVLLRQNSAHSSKKELINSPKRTLRNEALVQKCQMVEKKATRNRETFSREKVRAELVVLRS